MKSNYPQYNNFDSIQITCVCGVVYVYVWRLYSYDDMIYVCYYYIVLDVLHAHSIHSNLLLLCCYCWDSKYNVYHKFKTLSPPGIKTRYTWSYFMRQKSHLRWILCFRNMVCYNICLITLENKFNDGNWVEILSEMELIPCINAISRLSCLM